MCGMQVGSWVWAKHENQRFYKGRIIDITHTIFYMVSFPDGSFTDKLHPSLITVRYFYLLSFFTKLWLLLRRQEYKFKGFVA